jgi:phytoene/squalene synthetase
VGELVLHVFGAATTRRMELSERICAGLQVIEHLQDVAEDYARGRVYLPQEDLRAFGCGEDELAAATASDRLRALVAFQAERAAQLLGSGAPLAATLDLRARLAVAGFVAGGRSALAGIERAGYDVLSAKPGLSRSGFAGGFRRAVMGR